jgi:hypothetical protein
MLEIAKNSSPGCQSICNVCADWSVNPRYHCPDWWSVWRGAGLATISSYAVSIMEESGSALDKYTATIIFGVIREIQHHEGTSDHTVTMCFFSF